MNLLKAQKDFFNANRDGLITDMLNRANYCNITDTNLMSPLAIACINGNVSNVAQLLSVPGINVNIRDRRGRTPFILTVLGEAALDTYEKETRIASSVGIRRSSLTCTVFEEMKFAYRKTDSAAPVTTYIEILNLLLHHSTIKNNLSAEGSHAINYAIRKNKPLELVYFLLRNSKRTLTISQTNWAIHNSIINKKNCTQYLEALITTSQLPLDLNCVDDCNESPLKIAIDEHCIGCVNLLMAHPSVKTYECGQYHLSSLFTTPVLSCVDVIVGNLDEPEEDALIDVLNLLIQHPRTNVNAKPPLTDTTILHILVQMNFRNDWPSMLEPLRLLMKRPDLDLNLRSKDGQYHVLDLACMNYLPEVISRIIMDPRTHVNPATRSLPMFCYPICYSTPKVVRLYVKAGANPRATALEPITKTKMDMFWYNAVQSNNDKTRRDFKRRLEIGQIIINAGATPVWNRHVYRYLIKQANGRNPIYKRRMKRLLQKFEELCFNKCQSLAKIARAHLYDQMRLIRGPFTTTILCKRLLKQVPHTFHKFLQFEEEC